ncbi:MAG: hypothetical protein V1911_01480, partial [Candidatus Micrarchaeota archaeon]
GTLENLDASLRRNKVDRATAQEILNSRKIFESLDKTRERLNLHKRVTNIAKSVKSNIKIPENIKLSKLRKVYTNLSHLEKIDSEIFEAECKTNFDAEKKRVFQKYNLKEGTEFNLAEEKKNVLEKYFKKLVIKPGKPGKPTEQEDEYDVVLKAIIFLALLVAFLVALFAIF